MRQLRREMHRLRREMHRLHREMRRLRREMRRLHHECVDCVMECVDCVVECVAWIVKCVDCVWTSCIFSVTSDLTHWPNIDLWPYYIFMIMQIRPHPSWIFITPHEYLAPPLCCVTSHPSRDVTSEVVLNIHEGWWIFMRGDEYSWEVWPNLHNHEYVIRSEVNIGSV